MTIRIVVADERCLISEAIAETLGNVEDFEVVEVVDDDRRITSTVQRVRPAVAVLGSAASGRGELGLVDELKEAVPDCAITVITAELTSSMLGRAMAGAFSVIPHHARVTHLVHAIRGVVAGCPTVDPSLLRVPSRGGRRLNDRERQVLRLTVGGAPIKEIAAELYLSPGTVRNLTSSAIKKLEGRNRFDAARIAHSRGWL
ncbi:MAG TPA: response regulator transcription factor [Streptomyces sp.]|nr:response regulator transcription factor [Streptomyces sp.]